QQRSRKPKLKSTKEYAMSARNARFVLVPLATFLSLACGSAPPASSASQEQALTSSSASLGSASNFAVLSAAPLSGGAVTCTGALTGTGFSVVMAGGGNPCNVTWWIAQAVTMTTSNFSGTILAGAAITATVGTAGAFNGRALAKAAVTLTGGTLNGCTGGSIGDDDGEGEGDHDHDRDHKKH